MNTRTVKYLQKCLGVISLKTCLVLYNRCTLAVCQAMYNFEKMAEFSLLAATRK